MKALLPLLFLLADGRRASADAQDVVLIVADDLGKTELAEMPNVQALAAEGMSFNRFYSWPVCSPTRMALLYGLWPRRAGMGNVTSAHNPLVGSPAPDRGFVSLAEALLPSHKTALVGKWHLGRAWDAFAGIELVSDTESGPFSAGFERWLAGSPNSIGAGSGSTGYTDWYRVQDSTTTTSYAVHATLEQKDQFISWWLATPSPKFATLSWNAAHEPWPTGADRAAYLEIVRDLDVKMGQVLATIDLGETFVFFLGDNGVPDDARPEGWPAGVAKGTTYEGGVNVPLIVAGPGVGTGFSERLVSAADVPATILELTGAGSRGFGDSSSFANALGSSWTGTAPRAWLFSERYDVTGGVQPEGYDDIAFVEAETTLFTVPVKLKRRIVDADGIGPGGFEDMIYDLVSDPFEWMPSPYATAPAAVRARFDGYLASLPPRP